MTIITNTDTRAQRQAEIITTSDNALNWCIAVWPAPANGHTRIDGNGYGWQIVVRRDNGTYSYNTTMMGGYRDCLEDVKAMAVARGYKLINA